MAATRDALAERLQSIRKTASLLYNRMVENVGYRQEKLKDIVEKEAEEEQQQEEDVDLTPYEHERALKLACRSFVIPCLLKTDSDSYFDQTKSHIKALIKNQLKEMGSAKIILTLWARWKKCIMPFIELGPRTQKMLRTWMARTSTIRVEMPYNSLMTEFFEGSDINDLIQRMLAYIKA